MTWILTLTKPRIVGLRPCMTYNKNITKQQTNAQFCYFHSMHMCSCLRCIAKWRKRCLQPPKILYSFFILFLTISVIYSWLPVVDNNNISMAAMCHSQTILQSCCGTGRTAPSNSLAGDVCLRDYDISRCVLVDNRTLYESADLVVFHHFELRRHKTAPSSESPSARQTVVGMAFIRSATKQQQLVAIQQPFNLTMSYHPQADITVPYGKLLQRKPDLDFVIPKNKSYEACWVVSNYIKQHKRSAVFQELKNHLNVQLYGLAAKKTLPKEALLPTISRCYFYLAFENTVSPHYITEKLWRNSFQAGTVPVVLGPPRRDYEAVVPPNSFIHVDDFKSIKALAEYLRGLTKDPEKYNAYFTWRQDYTVKLYTDWRERLCNICPIYGQFPTRKVYEDLRVWKKW